jgi:hypothetical protein
MNIQKSFERLLRDLMAMGEKIRASLPFEQEGFASLPGNMNL